MEALAPPQQPKPLKIPSLPELRELFRLSASDEGLDLPSRKLAARITLFIFAVDKRLRALEKGKAEHKHVEELEKSMNGLVQYLAPILQMAAPPPEEGTPVEQEEPGVEVPLPEGVPQEGAMQGAEDAPAAAPQAAPAPIYLDEVPLPPVPPLQQPPTSPQLAPPMPPIPQGLRGPPRVKQRGQRGRHGGGAGGGS